MTPEQLTVMCVVSIVVGLAVVILAAAACRRPPEAPKLRVGKYVGTQSRWGEGNWK